MRVAHGFDGNLSVRIAKADIEGSVEISRQRKLATVREHASNLLRQCGEPMRGEIMAAFGALIESGDELTPSARHVVAVPEFRRLGLTDAAFTQLDSRLYTVLSADLDLILALQTKGFEVVNFHHLIFD